MELPPGLILVKDVITEEEEAKLIDTINENEWCRDLKRLTQHYGYKYDYSAKEPLESLGELPKWITDIKNKMLVSLDLTKNLDQGIVNRYLPGEGISAHIDHSKLFGDTIVALSLGSDVRMLFKRKEKEYDILLPRRSVVCMTRESRFYYTHEIKPRKSDMIDGKRVRRSTRYSITFRETTKN